MGDATAIHARGDQSEDVVLHGQHEDGVVEVAGRLGSAEVRRRLDARREAPCSGGLLDHEPTRAAGSRDEGGQRGRQAGPGELRREHAPGDLAQRLERGIGRDEHPGQR